MVKKYILILAVIAIFIIAFVAVRGEQDHLDETQQNLQEEVVATVNGDEVYMWELEQVSNIEGVLMNLQQYDQEFAQFMFSSPEGKDFINAYKRNELDNLISQILLEQEAKRKEITLSEEYKNQFFEEQLKMIKQQYGMNEEQLLEALSEQGMESLDDFREIIFSEQEDLLLVRKFIQEVVLEKVEVSEEEIKGFYEEQGIYVEFEEIKEQIEEELAREKYIENLKTDSKIDIFEEQF